MAIIPYQGKKPTIAEDAFISPRASVIGAATIGARSSVWEYAVIRADYNSISIGTDSSIQDNCTVHCDLRFPTKIGNRVTLGHNSVAHGCTIEDNVLVGIGAVLLNNVQIGHHSIIGAGSVITPGKIIPPESLVIGVPGKVVRSLTPADLKELDANWKVYVELSRRYLTQLREDRK
ncbi:MAG: gamma carbonic anhydrase family protein [Candidatus Hermodarchaeia archaeon]|jgi:carbonic anhydrase/acetyltransferase-like protein (isoleucine patch superfamily)